MIQSEVAPLATRATVACRKACAFLVAVYHWLLLLNRALTIDPIISGPRERCVIAGNVEDIKEHVKNMSSKRVLLHGIDPNEKSSPLKKQLREYTLTNGIILRNNDYCDVELETVITTRKRRKLRDTGSVKGNSTDTSHTLSSGCFVAGNDDPTLNYNEEGIEERYKGSSEIVSFPECVIEGDFSHVSEDDQEDTISHAYATAGSSECLEIEAGNGEHLFKYYFNFLLRVI